MTGKIGAVSPVSHSCPSAKYGQGLPQCHDHRHTRPDAGEEADQRAESGDEEDGQQIRRLSETEHAHEIVPRRVLVMLNDIKGWNIELNGTEHSSDGRFT